MILVQILLGVVTAHYGVEGDGFYGIPLSKWLPYSVTRTWHLQLGVLWIATAWLAAGLFIGPLVSGSEPKGQRLGVNLLFVALLVVVVGSMAGQWLSIQNHLSTTASFYFGHQGYEYIDLGRVWQIGLFVGLLLWLALVVRVVIPALKQSGEQRHLLLIFLMASTAIGLFYGAGLTWGQHTHLSIVEYWRWWVIHLWVEGFFEVFATTVIAFFFYRLNLVTPRLAAEASLLSATIFLAGGIIGTLPPSVLFGNAHGGAGLGIGVQRPGSRAVDYGRLSGHGRPAHVEGDALGAQVQVADLLLRRRGLLEHGRGRAVRLHD